MDIPSLLFSPNGRIGVRDFWRGAILLTGFWIVAQVLITYGGAFLGLMLGMLTWASVYCYLCVYGKRLHDSGRSAWYFVFFLAAFVFISGIVADIFIRLLVPEALEIRGEMEYLMRRGEWMEAMTTYGPKLSQMTLVPQMLSLLAANAILAYVGARLRSDPNANAHGEPTSYGDNFS